MVPGTLFLPIGLFLTGWTARASIHWIVPDIGIAFVGAGVILNFQSIQTYVIDAFTLHAASGLSFYYIIDFIPDTNAVNVCSTRRCSVPSFMRRVWVPAFCAYDV